MRLTLKGFVKVLIKVTPSQARLNGTENQIVTRILKVETDLDKPLELTPIHFNLDKKVTYTIEEVEKGKKFNINFTTAPSPPQAYRGFLKLKTNYPEKPELTIWIRVRIQIREQIRTQTQEPAPIQRPALPATVPMLVDIAGISDYPDNLAPRFAVGMVDTMKRAPGTLPAAMVCLITATLFAGPLSVTLL